MYSIGVISQWSYIQVKVYLKYVLAVSVRQNWQPAWRFTKNRPTILRSKVDERLNIFINLHLNFTSTSQLHAVYTKTVFVRRV